MAEHLVACMDTVYLHRNATRLSFIPRGQAQKLGDQVEEEEGCAAVWRQGRTEWCAGDKAGPESSSQESGQSSVCM